MGQIARERGSLSGGAGESLDERTGNSEYVASQEALHTSSPRLHDIHGRDHSNHGQTQEAEP
jgi:hypothetical protein